MSRIRMPDPLIVERDALDNAFQDWLINNGYSVDSDENQYWLERWADCSPSEPLVYTGEDMDGWDEDDFSAANFAMTNDLANEIHLKRTVLKEINQT